MFQARRQILPSMVARTSSTLQGLYGRALQAQRLRDLGLASNFFEIGAAIEFGMNQEGAHVGRMAHARASFDLGQQEQHGALLSSGIRIVLRRDRIIVSSSPGGCQMLKDKQKNGEATEAPAEAGKVSRKEFEKELAKLQVELTRLQTWVKDKGTRIIVVFEGRDTAGKGGVISRITARTSPRIYRHVALPVPSDREKTQLFIQRYIAHFPAAGEIVLFDRSWYNRAGVEREMIVNNGIILRKYFLDVSQDEQRRRFEARIKDPVKHWKLSPMDTESVRRWWDYTEAYQRMIQATHSSWAPWYIVPADNKRRARLNLIRHLLDSIPYKKVDVDLPKIPKAQRRPKNATEGLGGGQPITNHY
jgi:polyphosphate kinase 2 (PPK2 family)